MTKECRLSTVLEKAVIVLLRHEAGLAIRHDYVCRIGASVRHLVIYFGVAQKVGSLRDGLNLLLTISGRGLGPYSNKTKSS